MTQRTFIIGLVFLTVFISACGSKKNTAVVPSGGSAEEEMMSIDEAVLIAKREVAKTMTKINIPDSARINVERAEGGKKYVVTFLRPILTTPKGEIITGDNFYAIVTVDSITGKALVQGPR